MPHNCAAAARARGRSPSAHAVHNWTAQHVKFCGPHHVAAHWEPSSTFSLNKHVTAALRLLHTGCPGNLTSALHHTVHIYSAATGCLENLARMLRRPNPPESKHERQGDHSTACVNRACTNELREHGAVALWLPLPLPLTPLASCL